MDQGHSMTCKIADAPLSLESISLSFSYFSIDFLGHFCVQRPPSSTWCFTRELLQSILFAAQLLISHSHHAGNPGKPSAQAPQLHTHIQMIQIRVLSSQKKVIVIINRGRGVNRKKSELLVVLSNIESGLMMATHCGYGPFYIMG